MHRAFTFLLICASIILAASSSFSETNDALATIPAMASTIAANIDGTKTQGSSAQAVAKPELPRTSNVAGCFCCPCQGEESYSGKSRKRARLSVGDSAVQIEWDVAFSFLTMAIVLCGIWRFCKFERSVRKEPPPIRIKLHFVLRALVDTLEKAVMGAKDVEGIAETAMYYRDHVLAAMQEMRAVADEMESNMAAKYWPYPSYGTMLFSV